MKTKILVTGANGQLGKTIKELYEINNIGLEFCFVSKEDLDIVNQKTLFTYFNNYNFDYCINCAAYTNVDQAEKTPDIAYKVNAEGVKNLAQICYKKKTILIHISTDYVFDGETKTPYQINDDTNPINVYGKSKLLGEKYIKNNTTFFFIVRTSWLYSKKHGNNFYKTIVAKAKFKKELHITTDQIGCPTNAITLSKFIVKLIQNNNQNFGILHFCDEKAMTWYDFAKQILVENYLYQETKLVKVKNYCTFARRPRHVVLGIK